MGMVTVKDLREQLESYPSDAVVLVYEELHEVETMLKKCNSGIKIVNPNDFKEDIGFIITGH